MKLSRQDVRRAAQEILDFFTDCKISSFADLKPYLEDHSGANLKAKEFIEISNKNHGSLKSSISIAYVIRGAGIPLDARISEQLYHTHIICKSNEKLQGFEPLGTDEFGNLFQNKVICPSNFYNLRSELEALASDI